MLQVRRYGGDSEYIADVIYDEQMGLPDDVVAIDPTDATRRKRVPADCEGSDLLVPVFRSGRRVMEMPSIEESRGRAARQLERFHATIKRLVNPHEYPAGVAENLSRLRHDLILELRERR